jgi:hypothetical protein
LLGISLPEGDQTHVLSRYGNKPASEGCTVFLLGDLEQEPAIGIELLLGSHGAFFRRIHEVEVSLCGQYL